MKTNEKTSDRKEEASVNVNSKSLVATELSILNGDELRILNQYRDMNDLDLTELQESVISVVYSKKTSEQSWKDVDSSLSDINYLVGNLIRIRNRFSRMIREERESANKNKAMFHLLSKEWKMNLTALKVIRKLGYLD